MTQCERVVRHLLDNGSITGAEAMYEYGISYLPARIHDLKLAGYNITTQRRTSKNRYGESISYNIYQLGA